MIFRIQNAGPLRDVSIDLAKPLVILTGPNNSGKTYLAWSKELHEWIDSSKLSEQDINRGHFVIKLVTDAMAPTNTMANPAAVKRFFETGGKSLLDGLSHLAKDMGMFRAPSLRNVEVTGPYMHAGSHASLEDAVRLCRLRGRAMQEAVPAGEGAMANVGSVPTMLRQRRVDATPYRSTSDRSSIHSVSVAGNRSSPSAAGTRSRARPTSISASSTATRPTIR